MNKSGQPRLMLSGQSISTSQNASYGCQSETCTQKKISCKGSVMAFTELCGQVCNVESFCLNESLRTFTALLGCSFLMFLAAGQSIPKSLQLSYRYYSQLAISFLRVIYAKAFFRYRQHLAIGGTGLTRVRHSTWVLTTGCPNWRLMCLLASRSCRRGAPGARRAARGISSSLESPIWLTAWSPHKPGIGTAW